MKKLLSMVLALILAGFLVLTACAESVDLSALTWEELLELKARITLEQLTRDEWQEVEVPQGVYVVGEDIPAGKWTVKCKKGNSCYFEYGEVLSDDGHSIKSEGTYDWVYLYKEAGEDGKQTEYTFEAKEGSYIVIERSPVTFTPFTGKPDLGFKK